MTASVFTATAGNFWLRTCRIVACAIVVTGGLGACALNPTAGPTQAPAKRDNALLNDGYSLLYATVSGLRFSDDLLLVKFESDRLEKVIKDVSGYADTLKADLERVAKNYPAVRIDLKPLPEIEVEKRDAVNKDRLLSIAPVVGRSGPAFERTLLLSSSGALNQSQFLCQVMAEAEPDPNLKKLLLDAEKRFAGLYEEVVVLLNEVHFKHNTYKRK